MAKQYKIQAVKSYATAANAIKAVEKKFPESADDDLRYMILQNEEGRFFPVFIGMDALQVGVHFHFNVVA